MSLAEGVHPNKPYEPLIINACLTGVVADPKQTNVPMSVTEVIESACSVIEEGATILHCHARDEDGNNTWNPDVFGEIFTGIRKHKPDVVLCYTTLPNTTISSP